jgi:tetratricopeptide (TPR) repeat protein
MTDRPTESDPLQVALLEASQLLSTQPAQAAQRAQEILKAHQGHPHAALILGVARRIGGNLEGALQVLLPLARAQPGWAPPSYEAGVALGMAGRRKEAVHWLRRAVQLKADIGDAWRLIADHLLALGDPSGADAAYANYLIASTRDPRLVAPATALLNNRVMEAEELLRAHLTQNPTDVVAIRMQADVAVRLRRTARAEELLAYCLELAPGYTAARHDYALALHRLNRNTEALEQLEQLLAAEPKNPSYLNLKAAALTRLGDHALASEIYTAILADYPQNARAWISLGHTLRTTGRREEAVAAYRRAIELAPGLGEAWWALANIGALNFSEPDIALMRKQLGRADLTDTDRSHLRFALGKALEDTADYAESFRQYAEGNRLRRARTGYQAEAITAMVSRSRAIFTPEFFAERQGWGATAADPIFIVGLPHSGSTLVEQILASHSAVEGTAELLDLVALAWALAMSRKDAPVNAYPDLLAQVGPDELRELGERYLEKTRAYRKTDAPFFIDKLPNNWEHAGLIHLALPHAKIVDVRRDPMDCGFSCFKQLFASGQDFSYDLRDVGRYYRDYVELMAHFDAVLPGRIHRVDYRALVDDTEAEVRRLLEHCGLPFEDACLHFHEDARAVGTPGSEQVRSPVYHDSIGQWRHYEPWLGPLKEALGPLAG